MLWAKQKCLLEAFSHFPTVFSKALFPRVQMKTSLNSVVKSYWVKSQYCMLKGKNRPCTFKTQSPVGYPYKIIKGEEVSQYCRNIA